MDSKGATSSVPTSVKLREDTKSYFSSKNTTLPNCPEVHSGQFFL
jgi:hypothetical protein